MPFEAYVVAAVGAIILVLLVSMFIRRPTARVVQKKRDTDQVVIQLSRIADALEALVNRFGASATRIEKATERPSPSVEQPLPSPPLRSSPLPSPPPAEQHPEPVAEASDSSGTEQTKTNDGSERHVNLSMFGR
jgi:hypothetical protein